MNTITIIGNLTKDVEVVFSKDGKAISKFDIAENFFNKSKQEKEAQFFHVVAFGKTAENIAEYFKKGSRISVTGSMKNDRFTGKDGKMHDYWQILVQKFEFCERSTSAKSDNK